MQFAKIFLAALAAVAPVAAFTNGSLVPSYICNPHPDGLPKSYGQLLPYTRKGLQELAFNPTPGQNLNNTPPFKSTVATQMYQNSAYVMASMHNTLNSITVIQQGLVLKLASGGTSIMAGQEIVLILFSGTTGVALDGALVYANDGEGSRVGSFTDKSGMGIFKDFPGCGLNPQGEFAGVIQQMDIAENGTFTGLVFNAPTCIRGDKVTFAGLSVTDNGFGIWNYTFPVVGSICPDRTIEVLIIELIRESRTTGLFEEIIIADLGTVKTT